MDNNKTMYLLFFTWDDGEKLIGVFDNYQGCLDVMNHWGGDPDGYNKGRAWSIDTLKLNEVRPEGIDTLRDFDMEEL